MRDQIDYDSIDRTIITDEVLLSIIPPSDQKWGGSREIALSNAQQAYLISQHKRTNYAKQEGIEPITDADFKKMFDSGPALKKTLIQYVRSIYAFSILKDQAGKKCVAGEVEQVMEEFHAMVYATEYAFMCVQLESDKGGD